MPIAYGNGIKRPGETTNWTTEQVREIMKCGQDPMYFAENYYYIVHPSKGKMKIKLFNYQKRLINAFKDNKKNVVLAARQVGKALSIDSPILTPNGFVNIGDIQEGDVVYGRDGKKTKVNFITDILHDRDVYEIEFDNGEVIKACAEHLWEVSTSDWQRYDDSERILTTEELIPLHESLQSRSKPSSIFIQCANTVEFDEKSLDVHPYILGLWVGDGNKNDGRITCSIEDYNSYKDTIISLGYDVSEFRLDKRTDNTGNFNIVGLSKKLTTLGLKRNKHIPDSYMFNSVENRVQLIKGLMDSDGYSAKNGTCQFYQSNKSIIDQVRFVLSSLGIKTNISSKKTTHKDSWNITFTCNTYDLFSLDRKLDRQKMVQGHPKRERLYIRRITKIESEPVKCIQVDNEDHLFLAGKTLIPTHNTTCSALFILWYALFNEDKFIAILANQQKNAKSIVDEIKIAYESMPDWLKPGVEEYNNLTIRFENGTEIQAAATSPNALRGQSVSLLFLDEFAFIPENMAEDFWRSNYPTVHSNGGSVIIVSTPNGAAGKFYDIYTDAENGKNDFNHIKVAWDEHPDRDEAWKEETIKEFGLIAFMQEYQLSFTGSTKTLIEGDTLSNLVGIELTGNGVREDGHYLIYIPPKPNRLYAIGADTSQGVGGDSSTINIFDITDYRLTRRLEQVATWSRNDIGVFEFAEKLYEISNEWNEPFIIIENNHLGGVVAKKMYFDYSYENLFYDSQKGDWGINANVATKALALTHFKDDIESGRMIIKSTEMIKELGYFEEVKDGIFRAKKGRNFHDDFVSSAYWVSYMVKDAWFEDAYKHRLEVLGVTTKYEQNSEVIHDESILDTFMGSIGNGTGSLTAEQATWDMEMWLSEDTVGSRDQLRQVEISRQKRINDLQKQIEIEKRRFKRLQ